MIVISHPTGSEFVRQAALAFAETNLLERFWTTINWDPDSAFNVVVPSRLRKTLARRSYPPAVRVRTKAMPFHEAARLALGALNLPLFSQRERGFLSIDAICRALDRAVAADLERNGDCQLVYAYEDCALRSFETAKRHGILRVYDLPIGYWRAAQRIFGEEREREPEWAGSLTGARDSAGKLARKDSELRLADRVIVASTFTKITLAESPAPLPAVEVIPYGAPPVVSGATPERSGKLKILFAGALGQRKGLSYLLRAVEMLSSNTVELTLLGRKVTEGCPPLETAVRKHRWIPSLPHAEVLREMRQHDVLVFPSLFEGFGLVITEALSQGTPVITTAHTAGPDLIEDGIDGFIVPIRSSEAIGVKLELLASNRDMLNAMRNAAQEKARGRTWESYRLRLAAMARELIKN
jgi:starch synthase